MVREPGTIGYSAFRQLPVRWKCGQWARAGCGMASAGKRATRTLFVSQRAATCGAWTGLQSGRR